MIYACILKYTNIKFKKYLIPGYRDPTKENIVPATPSLGRIQLLTPTKGEAWHAWPSRTTWPPLISFDNMATIST